MTDDYAQANPIDLRKLLVEDFAAALPELIRQINQVDASFVDIGLEYARVEANPLKNRLDVLKACRSTRRLTDPARRDEVEAIYDRLRAVSDRQELDDALARQDGPALREVMVRLSTQNGAHNEALFKSIQPALRDQFNRSLARKNLAYAADLAQAMNLYDESGAPERAQTLLDLQKKLTAETSSVQARLDETTELARKKALVFEAVCFAGDYLADLVSRKNEISPENYGGLIGEVEERIRAFGRQFSGIKNLPEYDQNLEKLRTAKSGLEELQRKWKAARELAGQRAGSPPPAAQRGTPQTRSEGASTLTHLTFWVALLTLLGLLTIGAYWLATKPLQQTTESIIRTAEALIPTPADPTATPTATPTARPTVTPTAWPQAALKWEFDISAARCMSAEKLYDLPPVRLRKDQGGRWKMVACDQSIYGVCYSDGVKQVSLRIELTQALREDWKALEGLARPVEEAEFFVLHPDPGTREKPIKPLAAGDYKLRLTYEGDKFPLPVFLSISRPFVFTPIISNVTGRNEPFGVSISDYFKGQIPFNAELMGWAKDQRKEKPVDFVVCVRLRDRRFENIWLEGQALGYNLNTIRSEVPELKP